ncbi:uncharacterized protein [Arachis hypogaea]|uniref:uncharacterized protein isoform X1 n=1 Tax=Arachis hypogaea TaxID=3818 RepID=UPI003B20F543
MVHNYTSVSIALLIFCPVYMQFFLIETVKVAPRNNHESGCYMKVVDFLNQRYKSMRKAAEIVMFSPTLRGMATVTFFYKLGMSGINSVLPMVVLAILNPLVGEKVILCSAF